MTRVLVTGGSGFVGRHTSQALVQIGCDVVVASRAPDAIAGAQVVAVDLLNDDAPQQLIHRILPDVLVHLAWETETGVFWSAESNTEWLKASLALHDAFLKNGGARSVFAGSCAEYDWSALGEGGIAHETNTPCVPATPYAVAKCAFFSSVHERIADGASCAWGRIFMLYGEREHPQRFVSSIIRNLLSQREAPMSSGRQIRDFLDTRDAGRAFAELAVGSMTGAINIGSGTGLSLKNVAEMIGNKLNRSDLLNIGAMDDRSGEPESLVADVTRLRDELGFHAAYDLLDGLDHAIDYWSRQNPDGVTE